jgi:signal transduction histidine kinase/ActR/RegA family two-component response regulator
MDSVEERAESFHRANTMVWKGSIRGGAASLMLSSLVVGGSSAPTWLWAWPACFALLALLRRNRAHRFFFLAPAEQRAERVAWRRWATVISGLTGLLWIPGVVLMWQSTELNDRLLVIIVISGLIPGATVSLSAIPPAFLAMVVPLWLGAVLALSLGAHTLREQLFAASTVVLMPLLLRTGRALHTEFERVTTLTIRQAGLMEELGRARDTALAAAGARSEFLAVMSHELRTPLNGVVGLTELLLQTRLDAEQQQLAADARESAQVLISLISGVLDLSKIDAGHLELEVTDVALREEVGKLRALFELRAKEKQLTFVVDVGDEVDSLVRGDWYRLRQVLVNLIGNALKFTERGSITCRVRRGAAPRWVRFEVEDTGIGLSPEQLQRLFRPFAQADASIQRRFGGTGLGLTISKRLVELMGGELVVASVEGQGTTFSFEAELPAAAVASSASMSAAQAPVVSLAGRRLLVCDDNEINLKVASRLLEKVGCVVELARNGAEALRALEHASFDAVLMDLQMPVMDGFEAVRRAKASGSRIDQGMPFVALTASAGQADHAQALAAGFDAWVTKPIEPARLFGTIERLVAANRP